LVLFEIIDEICAIQFKNDNELVQIREIRGKKTNWCVCTGECGFLPDFLFIFE